MKFTKEEVYEELVKRLTKNGESLNLTSRTLAPTLEILMKNAANDETELNDFVNMVLPSAIAMNGQYRKDNSDFIKKWNEEHPVVNPKDDKDDKKKDEEPKNPEFAAILAEVAELKDRFAKEDKARAISNKRSELAAAMEKKGIKDKSWRDDFLAEINITEDMDIESKADSFLKIYNKSKASEQDDFTPLSPNGDKKNKEDLFGDIKKEFDREQERKKDLI